MSEVKFIGEIEKMVINPGDKFVMTSDRDLSWQQGDAISANWRKFAGDKAKLLVLPAGFKLSVISEGRDAEADIYARTGRPHVDHGTAMQAIEFALDKLQVERDTFLSLWREGNLDEFPEFYEWLKSKESPS